MISFIPDCDIIHSVSHIHRLSNEPINMMDDITI
uniref:Uncharacterized protein n=1 Tax=viral metagenome TaxID=1070528 RepID=A0A6C0BNY1_9ZZZZ